MAALRRLFLWLAALAIVAVSAASPAQVARPGAAPGLRGGLAPTIYDPDAIAFVAAMSVQPDANHKASYAATIRCLKGKNPQLANPWATIDWISFLAAHDAQAARINVKNPAQVATVNGTATFTADRGYKGDGSSGYLETSVADNAAGNSTQDSSTIFSYANVAPTVAAPMLGLSSGSLTRVTGSSGAALGRVHSSTILTSTVGNSTGFIAYAHTAVNANVLYRGSVADVTDSTAGSAAPSASTFRFLGGSTFSDVRQALAGWGGGMTASQVAALSFCMSAFLTPIGAG